MKNFRKTFLFVYTLMILQLCCKKSELVKLCFIPYVDFVAYNVNPNTLEVSFKDTVSYNGTITSHSWDFGDGTNYSGTQIPLHTYPKLSSADPVKTYHIKYTVTNDCGTAYWTKDIAVGPCLANVKFTYTYTNDSTIQFINTTTSGSPATYLWQFNDGTTSSSGASSFSKSYKTSGTYSVSLKASNTCGDNFWTESIVIKKKPTMAPTTVTSIKATTATASGTISNDGGLPVTERGVCWSTSPDPTIKNSVLKSAATTSSFSVTLPNLTPGTKYYARAYAINDGGPAYGDPAFSFTTLLLPTVTTGAITGTTSIFCYG